MKCIPYSKRIVNSSLNSIRSYSDHLHLLIGDCDPVTKYSCDSECISKDINQPRIVIVGAGIAGLSAAERLAQCGFKNIVILEGNNRLGGRIHTCSLDGGHVDAGAQWLYGATFGNPIFSLASQEKLLSKDLVGNDRYKASYMTPDGVILNDYVKNTAVRIFKNMIKAKSKISAEMPLKASVLDYFIKEMKHQTSDLTPNSKAYVKRILLTLFNDLKAIVGAELNDLPLESYKDYHKISGPTVPIIGGYQNVIKAIAKKLPKEAIKTGHEVFSIQWAGDFSDSARAIVHTCNGPKFKADFVILTVSLGVLQKYHPTMFCPVLPPDKVKAINNIGFGHVNKVFFKYDRSFWLHGDAKMRPIWTLQEFGDQDSWVKSIGIIDEPPGTTNILSITVGGWDALCIERLPDEELAIQFTQILRKLTTNGAVPLPSKILRTMWSSHNYYLGARSYLPECSSPNDVKLLAQSLPTIAESPAPTLLFAGEATMADQYGNVNGARSSGFREAEKIIEITNMFGGPPPKPNPFCSS